MATTRVKFEVRAGPDAVVAVAGSFSSWQPIPMQEVKRGEFGLSLDLSPGSYEYKFIIDGTWMADPECEKWCINDFGTLNSICQVKAPRRIRRPGPVPGLHRVRTALRSA
jgi:hypothetical protein